MKSIMVMLMLAGASGSAFAKQVPLHAQPSRAKPDTSGVQASKPASMPEDAPASAPSGCATMLREIAEFAQQPDRAGPGECGASDLVRLNAVKMPDGSRVAMSPPATLRCKMAESVAEWVRAEMAPAVAAELGAQLKALVTSESYDCRPRNGIKGARMSEHGRGNAMDIAGLKLKGGATVDLTKAAVAKALRDRARVSACGRFTTVLGPGADAHHEDHIHVDLAERGRGQRICQWDVREPPVVATAAPPAARWPVAAAPPAAADATPVADDVPLPLRRPFELVYGGGGSRYR
jgi:hypothetical protein